MVKSTTAAADEITEDEFEALLDELHGKGKFTGLPTAKPGVKAKQSPPKSEAPKASKSAPAAAPVTAEKKSAQESSKREEQ